MASSAKVVVTHHGHAQHFIAADSCRFRLATEVVGPGGRWVISTVGEMVALVPFRRRKGFDEIGSGRLYETYVFALERDARHDCGCPKIASLSEIQSRAANSAQEATANHADCVAEWSLAAKDVSSGGK